MKQSTFNFIKEAYNSSSKRLLFLDLEGTLVPSDLNDVSGAEGLHELLFRITNDSNNDVVLLSRQSQEQLDDSFSHLPLTLVSENGGSYRPSKGEWQSLVTSDDIWKEPIERAMRASVKQYPTSYLEIKHFSIVWRYADIHIIPHTERKQLQVAWRSLARQHQVTLQEHYQSVEFTAPGISKGKFAAFWVVTHSDYDFILAIGDDATDENLFEAIGDSYFTVKVGGDVGSAAKANLGKQEDVLPFLTDLIDLNKRPDSQIKMLKL
jgi:trehalose 6-phosphate synthase/phosphatase